MKVKEGKMQAFSHRQRKSTGDWYAASVKQKVCFIMIPILEENGYNQCYLVVSDVAGRDYFLGTRDHSHLTMPPVLPLALPFYLSCQSWILYPGFRISGYRRGKNKKTKNAPSLLRFLSRN